jgi:hypothetical protein
LFHVLFTDRFGQALARAAVLVGILVLVCVPALTRVGQRLETSSLAPSFSRNIDCPPKKVTIAPVLAVASPILLRTFATIPVARLTPAPATILPRSPHLAAPLPLRAPPSAFFA